MAKAMHGRAGAVHYVGKTYYVITPMPPDRKDVQPDKRACEQKPAPRRNGGDGSRGNDRR